MDWIQRTQCWSPDLWLSDNFWHTLRKTANLLYTRDQYIRNFKIALQEKPLWLSPRFHLGTKRRTLIDWCLLYFTYATAMTHGHDTFLSWWCNGIERFPPCCKRTLYKGYYCGAYSISQEICTRFCCALLCCGYAIVYNEFTWSIYPYSSGLLCWHWGNR